MCLSSLINSIGCRCHYILKTLEQEFEFNGSNISNKETLSDMLEMAKIKIITSLHCTKKFNFEDVKKFWNVFF